MISSLKETKGNDIEEMVKACEVITKWIAAMRDKVEKHERLIEELLNDKSQSHKESHNAKQIPDQQGTSEYDESSTNKDKRCVVSPRGEDKSNKTEQSGLVSQTKQFMESSTLHGLSRLTDPSIWTRILWLIAIIGAITTLALQIFALTTEYLAFGVVTKVEVKQGHMIFPAISVCNNKPILASKLVKLHSFANLSAQVSDPVNAWLLSERLYRKYDHLLPHELSDLGSDVSDTIAAFAYPGGVSAKVEAIPYRGSCFIVEPPMDTTSLDIIFNLHINDSIKPSIEKTRDGIAVLLKDSPFANFASHPLTGFYVWKGREDNGRITYQVVNRLNGSYNQCDNNEQLFYDRTGITYEQEACMEECIFRNIIEKCSCLYRSHSKDVPSIFPYWLNTVLNKNTTIRNCDRKSKSDSKCIYNEGVNRKYCPCNPKCSEKAYSLLFDGRKGLGSYNCTRNPNSLLCGVIRKWSFQNSTDFWLNSNIAVAKLKMSKDPYKVYTQMPEYPLLQFLADLGGTMGFYLGASMLTYFEAVFLMIFTFVYVSKKFQRKL